MVGPRPNASCVFLINTQYKKTLLIGRDVTEFSLIIWSNKFNYLSFSSYYNSYFQYQANLLKLSVFSTL